MNPNQAWITMFRKIPATMHDGLTVGLRSGVEVAIQTILRLEPDFIILRGRLTGTQEGGKILLLPYAEMTVLSIVQPLKDPEVEAIFGKADAPAVIDKPAASADAPALPAAAPTEEPAKSETAAAAKKSDQASRGAVLAKLRERLKDVPPGK